MTWKDSRLCNWDEGDWVEIPQRGLGIQRAEKAYELAVCTSCPVREPCLEAGMSEPTAIYGGLLPRERRKLQGKTK